MGPLRQSSISVLVYLSMIGCAHAQEPGDQVVVKKDGGQVWAGKELVSEVDIGRILTVQKATGNWLAVRVAGKTGWIHKTAVVPLDQAIAYFSGTIQRGPDAKSHYARGRIHQYSGALDEAISDYTEAIGLDSSLLPAYDARATAWLRKGDAAKAGADFFQSARTAPQGMATDQALGALWAFIGQLDKADVHLRRAAHLDPDMAVQLSDLWGPRLATPGAKLIYDDIEQVLEEGRTETRTVLRATNMPRDTTYTLWVRWLDGRLGASGRNNWIIDETGLVVGSDGSPLVLNFYNMLPGEPIAHALISSDAEVKAFSDIIPFLLEATGPGDYRISLRLITPEGLSFLLQGGGLPRSIDDRLSMGYGYENSSIASDVILRFG